MDTLQLSPGWYTDAEDPALVRFWTGTAWSAHRKPRPGLPTPYQEARRRGSFREWRRIR